MGYFTTSKILLLPLLLAPFFPNTGQAYLYDEEDENKPLSVLLLNSIYTGHLMTLVSIGEELVSRGHKVTLIANTLNGSHAYPEIPERVGVKFISSGYDKYFTVESFSDFHKQMYHGNITQKEITQQLHKVFLSSIQIKNKVEEMGVDQFDIIICDTAILIVGVYFHVLGRKAVILSPLIFSLDRVELQWPTPLPWTGQSSDISRLDRFLNTLIFRPLLHYVLSSIFEVTVKEDEGYRRVLQYNNGGLEFAYYHGMRLPKIIANSFGFEYPIPRLPLVEYVGPVPLHSPPVLSKDLKQWLDNKTPNSVIYISMGTTGTLPASTMKAIYDGIFLYTSYSAVWVMKEQDQTIFQKLIANVHPDQLWLSDWVSQQSLLRHRAIAISIIHCGTNSVFESIYNGHPVICIPSIYDQFDSAIRVVSAGVGVSLYNRIDVLLGNTMVTAQTVTNAINRVSEGNYCSLNISRLRKSFQLAGGARRAADLIEFYEDVGYDHLVPAYVKYEWSWVQYYNYDVWMAFLLTLVLSLCCCWRLFSCIWAY